MILVNDATLPEENMQFSFWYWNYTLLFELKRQVLQYLRLYNSINRKASLKNELKIYTIALS